MNHRARRPNFVTQDSDDSEDDFNPRDFNRGRIAAIRRRRNRNISTIPDDNSTSNLSLSSSPSTRHTNSSSTSSEAGWLNTRKIRSPEDRVRFRENATKHSPIRRRFEMES